MENPGSTPEARLLVLTRDGQVESAQLLLEGASEQTFTEMSKSTIWDSGSEIFGRNESTTIRLSVKSLANVSGSSNLQTGELIVVLQVPARQKLTIPVSCQRYP